MLEDVREQTDPAGVLLVDDHRENLAALEAVLEPLGEQLISAESGEAALRVLLHREVAVILLDVRMSGLDGLQTARLIRSRPTTRHIPIIFLTALASDAREIERAYESGAVDYVVKPFEPSILRAKVTAFVALSRERAERLRQSRARARAEAATRAVRTLQSLSDAALAHLELEPLATELLDRACTLFNASDGALLLNDAAGEEWHCLAKYGGGWPDGEPSVSEPVHGLLASGTATSLTPDGDAFATLAPTGAHQLLAIPLREPDRQLPSGLLLLAARRTGTFDAADLSLLELAADRIAIAISHAQRFEQQRDMVQTLQHSLLPDRLPDHPDLELAARYLPEESGTRVGGDWYDAVALDDHRIALMIGDVVGHGLPAATRMGELRTALRAYTVEGHEPGRALQRLERLVQATIEPQMVATVLLAVLDLHTRSITLARAGHPPPLVRGRDGTVRALDSGSTLPLGISADQTVSDFTYALADGETILLYTDGLIERRTEPLDAGINRLMMALGGGPGTPQATCDRVLERLIGSQPPSDDVAILAVYLRGPQPELLRLELPAIPDSVTTARHRLRGWLQQQAPELDATTAADLELAFTEAVTNVVRHAYGPVDATFEATARRRGPTVELTVRDEGTWRPPRATGGGLGLRLMEALCDEMTIDQQDRGTTINMRWSSIH